VGQAGLGVDPTDVEALARAMERVLTGRDLRDQMRVAGPAQAQSFSWQRTAQGTVDSYRRALHPKEGKGDV
jgi:glycosyltransferase involved in cell wall biosynthesis